MLVKKCAELFRTQSSGAANPPPIRQKSWQPHQQVEVGTKNKQRQLQRIIAARAELPRRPLTIKQRHKV